MNIPDFKMIYDLTSNQDTYMWKDLNCFYKPIGIIHNSFEEDYQKLFLTLMTAYFIFKKDDPMHNFVKFYNENFASIFNIQVSEASFSEEEEFINDLTSHLSRGIPILVGIDLFNVYYDGCYMLRHAKHFIPCKGYDLKRKLFYCVDTLHNNSSSVPIYINDIIPFHMLWEMYGKETYLRFDLKGNTRDYKEISPLFFEKLESFYRKRVISKDRSFDVDVLTLNNTRVVYYNELLAFLRKIYANSNIVATLDELKDEILKLWNKEKLTALYNEERKEDKLDNSIFEILSQKEQEFHELLFKTVRENSILNDSIDTKDLSIDISQVINKNDLPIQYGEDKIIINHKSNCTSNLYFATNDAPQIYFKIKDKKKVEFKVTVESLKKQKNAIEFQDGINIRFVDGSRVMFGLHRDNILLVDSSEFNIEVLEKKNSNKIYLFIDINDRTIDFKYKMSLEEEYTSCYKFQTDILIKDIGIFSRTWSSIEHTAIFSDLEYPSLLE